MIGNSVPTFSAYRVCSSQLAALRPTHQSFQLEVRFLNSLFSCNVREMSIRSACIHNHDLSNYRSQIGYNYSVVALGRKHDRQALVVFNFGQLVCRKNLVTIIESLTGLPPKVFHRRNSCEIFAPNIIRTRKSVHHIL